jgi:ketosteroid isomerase-like protein
MNGREEDVARMRGWFQRLTDHVQAVDYVGARPLFAEDLIAFGTFADFVTGRDATEQRQWRSMWPTIDHFHCRLDDLRTIVSADRLTAVGITIFDSTGYNEDGGPYDGAGRARAVFGRATIGADRIAQHTHFSLCRGVPDHSFGDEPERIPT